MIVASFFRRIVRTLKIYLAIFLSCVFLSSCAGPAILAGSFTAMLFGHYIVEERAVLDSTKDIKSWVSINRKLKAANFDDVNIVIYEGRVLATGRVKNKQERGRVSEIVWEDVNTKEFIDEMIVSTNTYNIVSMINDPSITSFATSKLLIHPKIRHYNYKITTYNNVLYILGTAYDNDEMDMVLSEIRITPSALKVVSHIRTKDHPLRNNKDQ